MGLPRGLKDTNRSTVRVSKFYNVCGKDTRPVSLVVHGKDACLDWFGRISL